MTIEDIDYLKKNCKKENFILFIDSRRRNKAIGHAPGEYVVIFDEPFKNVYGLEILDASIPRTMYIIDKYNDTFEYTIRYNNTDYNIAISFDHQDYNIETLLAELTKNLTFDIGTNSISISAFSLSTPYDRKGKIYYECKYPFKFNFKKYDISETLGFDEFASTDNSDLYNFINDQEFGSITSQDTGNETHQYTLYDLGDYFEQGIINNGIINYFDTDNANKYVNIYKNHSAMQIFNQIEDTYNYSNYNRSVNTIIIYIGLKHTAIPDDYLDPSSLMSLNITWEIREYNKESNIFSIALLSGKINDSDPNIKNTVITTLQNKKNLTNITPCINPMYKVEITLNSDGYNLLQYSGNNGNKVLSFILHEDTKENEQKDGLIWYYDTMDSNYIDNVSTKQIESMRLFSWNNSTLLENNNQNDSINILIIDDPLLSIIYNSFIIGNSFALTINSSYKRFSLTPAGRVSLVGERFIILRCPEIESQLSGSYAYGSHSPGLALFKLGVLGYADARFDFSSINYKEFHPIGKLEKLHLRFETSNGDVYDFKGVNHNLLIVVKFLRPAIDEPNNNYYPLNTNYNPSYIDYMKNQNDILNNEESDEDEIDFLQKNFNKIYLEKEKKFIDNSDDDINDNVSDESDTDI
jgi:hypothetical protein